MAILICRFQKHFFSNEKNSFIYIKRRIHLIVGAGPNFMKMAPLYKALKEQGDRYTPALIHTGQHYDEKMSKLCFEDLDMPEPEAYLHVGSGTHGLQTVHIIEGYEE